LHHAAQVGSGEHISIEFADGRIDAVAGNQPEAMPKKTKSPPKQAATAKKVQGDLF